MEQKNNHNEAEIFRTSPTSPSGPVRALITPKMAPFSGVGGYNRYTTQQPVICQFEKMLIP